MSEHAFSSVYKEFAIRMLTVAEAHLRAPGAAAHDIELQVGGITVKVRLDHAESGDGGVVRRYKTGRRPKSVDPDLSDALRLMAGRHVYGPKARLQVHFLSSEDVVDLEIKDKALENRLAKVCEIAQNIATGKFPVTTNVDQCPRCPFFFLCPAVPEAQ